MNPQQPHTTLTEEDLRAGTAAGIIDEAQAARLTALAHQRAGRLARSLPEDEPFELFSGFAEIFISVGLVLLISSAAAFAAAIGGVAVIAPLVAVLCWVSGLYFTLRRRMTLPSIVLVSGYATGVGGFIGWALDLSGLENAGLGMVVFGMIGMALMLLHFRRFRVPFSMFIAGLFGLFVVFGFVGNMGFDDVITTDWTRLLDLREGGRFAFATLIFGTLAFAAGLSFDLRDPHRVGRLARSAFWLHLLAAPALVNTVMMTAWNVDGLPGMALTVLGLMLITAFALVIDRRSFLTAGLGYLAGVILWALQLGDTDLSVPTLMLVLGAIVTYLGTFWTALRMRLMYALPNFPGKSRLPPYSELP